MENERLIDANKYFEIIRDDLEIRPMCFSRAVHHLNSMEEVDPLEAVLRKYFNYGQEAVMNNSIPIKVFFEGGTFREACIPAGVFSLGRYFAVSKPHLFEGTGFNPLAAEVSRIVAVTRPDHDVIHQCCSGQRKADFRLGQLDMQASVSDMLRQLANGATDPVSAGLVLAADLVESMEVPNANS